MVFMYEYLRRKGMDRLAESLAMEAELSSADLSACVEFVMGVMGPPVPQSGFLLSWWQTFWEVFCGSVEMRARAAQEASSPMMVAPAPLSKEEQFARFNRAMNKAGLAGRDPNQLTAAEKQMLAMALASESNIPSPSGPTILPKGQRGRPPGQASQQQPQQQQQKSGASTKNLKPLASKPTTVQQSPESRHVERAVVDFLTEPEPGRKRNRQDQEALSSASSLADTREFFDMNVFGSEPADHMSDPRIGRLEPLGTVAEHHGEKAVAVHFTQDGKYLASAGVDRHIHVIDTSTGEAVGTLPVCHSGKVTSMRMAQEGSRMLLATSSVDKTVQVWDLGPVGAAIRTLPSGPAVVHAEHQAPVTTLDLSRELDGNGIPVALYSADSEGTLIVYSLSQQKIMHIAYRPSKSPIRAVKAQPGKGSLVALLVDDRVEFFNWRLGKNVYEIRPEPGKPVFSLAWDRGLVVFGTLDRVFAWSLDFGTCPDVKEEAFAGRCVAVFDAKGDKVSSVSFVMPVSDKAGEAKFQPRHRRVILATYRRVCVWMFTYSPMARTSQTIDEVRRAIWMDAHEGVVSTASSNQTRLAPLIASGGHDSKIKLWRLMIPPRPPKSGASLSDAGSTASSKAEEDPFEFFLDTENMA
jgi:WD40 repeat protein